MATESRARRPSKPVSETEKRAATLRLVTALLGLGRFVLVHNHPSGSVHPSAGDVRVTKRIAAGARMLKINFLDHVIVGQPIAGFLGYFSFHEAGLLRRQNKKTKNL